MFLISTLCHSRRTWHMVTENCMRRKILKCCVWRLILKDCIWCVISKHCVWHRPDASQMQHFKIRKLHLAENFPMLLVTPGFEMLCLILKYCIWCPPDITFPNQASGTRFQNHASDVIFSDHASDVQYDAGCIGLIIPLLYNPPEQSENHTVLNVILISLVFWICIWVQWFWFSVPWFFI